LLDVRSFLILEDLVVLEVDNIAIVGQVGKTWVSNILTYEEG
jgi:hypothetical protein